MTFKALVESILGVYHPVILSGSGPIEGVAGIDFAYVTGCLLLLVTVYSLFRIIGMFIGGR